MKGLPMKFTSNVRALCLAAAVPLCATAGSLAPASSSIEPSLLGRLDAMLTVCARVDERNRTTYQGKRLEMITFGEGTPYEVRVEGSDTPAYKEAFMATMEAAGKATAEQLVGECRQVIGARPQGD
jgi:hypothetical protein